MDLTKTAPQDNDLLYGKRGPSLKQQQFRDSGKKYKLYGGAVGGGKSWALSAEGIRQSLLFPGNRGYMCRNEATAFKNTTLQTLLKLISEIEDVLHAKILKFHNLSNKEITFINGSRILYGDAQDKERIKSLEVGWFCIDEASEVQEDSFDMLTSRLRWKLPDGTYPHFCGLLASNPEPGWLKQRFIVPFQMGEEIPDHAFIKALPTDNQELPEDYVAGLRRTKPEHWVKRYLEGSWDAVEGQIWADFSYDIHSIKPFDIPRGWKKFRALDHGQTHPTCCLWFAIDPDGNIFVYREYYSPGIVSKHCSEIREMSGDEDYIYSKMSPDAWGKTKEKRGREWSTYDEYREQGLYFSRANNNVEAGLNRVGEFFRVREDRIHPRTGEMGSPTLFIFKDCRNLLLEIPEYQWKESRTAETIKEQPKKIRDDACDALRYGIMSRPTPTSIHTSTPYGSFNYHMKEQIKKEQKNRKNYI